MDDLTGSELDPAGDRLGRDRGDAVVIVTVSEGVLRARDRGRGTPGAPTAPWTSGDHPPAVDGGQVSARVCPSGNQMRG